MNTHYLTSLFTPNTIALFGASDRENSVGGVVFRNLLSAGFEGRIFAINPKHDKVQGEKAYASLAEVGEPVDLAVAIAAVMRYERYAFHQPPADIDGGRLGEFYLAALDDLFESLDEL